jgi:hypothetical protein
MTVPNNPRKPSDNSQTGNTPGSGKSKTSQNSSTPSTPRGQVTQTSPGSASSSSRGYHKLGGVIGLTVFPEAPYGDDYEANFNQVVATVVAVASLLSP